MNNSRISRQWVQQLQPFTGLGGGGCLFVRKAQHPPGYTGDRRGEPYQAANRLQGRRGSQKLHKVMLLDSSLPRRQPASQSSDGAPLVSKCRVAVGGPARAADGGRHVD